MEYSKEDLMEAKKQIWGVGENMGTEESKKIWEENAQFWDNAMGDESNEFHREVVRPKVTELLSPNPADYILDIACGNGNYSSYLAQRGASVVAFDYSKKMIELAKRRQSQYAKQIEFCVADATDRKSILELKRNRAFTKAVSNMAIMDITDIEPLLMAVYELLQESGIFVFATQHPCFVTLTEKYMTPHSYYDIAIEGQPKEQIYYHRSIQDIFNLCFRAGFVIDGFYEECFKTNKEIPMVMIVRLKKVKRDTSQSTVKMNGAYAQPLTAPPAFAGRQSRGDSKKCHRPALLFRKGNFHDRPDSLSRIYPAQVQRLLQDCYPLCRLGQDFEA